MRWLTILWGWTRMSFIELRRYWLNTFSGVLTLYLLFLFIFFGAKAAIGPTPGRGETLGAIIIGYIVWTLSIFAFSETSQEVSQHAMVGTLEQLAMSPAGLPAVLLARFVANIAFNLAITLLMLLVAMATTGRWLNLDLPSVLPLMIMIMLGVQGVGFIAGGLSLVFKKVQSLLQIIQFVFIALVAFPVDRFPWLKAMPMAWGNELIRRVMIDDASLVTLPAGDLLFLVVHSAVWLLVGYAGFAWTVAIARDRALLGQY